MIMEFPEEPIPGSIKPDQTQIALTLQTEQGQSTDLPEIAEHIPGLQIPTEVPVQ